MPLPENVCGGARLSGKVALISGGGRGQGEAQARRFVSEGCRVVIADLPDGGGEALSRELGEHALWCPLNVSNEADWTRAVELTLNAFGHLDILMNNAGISRGGRIEDMLLSEFRQIIDVNQIGVWLGMKAVIQAMRDAGGGSIVNTASTGALVGLKDWSAYSASKFAVLGMTYSAAAELGEYDIRVNAICPGMIRTPMLRGPDGSAPEIPDAVLAHQPVPRLGSAEEVANLALFLASDEASYCTGAHYVIDGGYLAAPPLLRM